MFSRLLSQVVDDVKLEMMSGHSKWSTIKHKKAATDAKRGAVFGRVAKKIYLAVKQGGSGDGLKNSFLRNVLEEARSVNMPSDNVRRAIDKALGVGGGQAMTEIEYEGYGQGGVGIIIVCVTDNKNRSGGEIRGLFDKCGGSLSEPGSVSYMKKIDPIPEIELKGEDLVKTKDLLKTLEEHEDVVSVWSNLKQ
jgi:YebC/PmpR family DNA-binding regulatory protein